MQIRSTPALLVYGILCAASLQAQRLALFIDYRTSDYAWHESGDDDEEYTAAEESLITSFSGHHTDLEYLRNPGGVALGWFPITRLLACALAEQTTPLLISGRHLLDNILLWSKSYRTVGGSTKEKGAMALYSHVHQLVQNNWQLYYKDDFYLLIPKAYQQEMIGWFNPLAAGMTTTSITNIPRYNRHTDRDHKTFCHSLNRLVEKLLVPAPKTTPWWCYLAGHGSRYYGLGGLSLAGTAQLFWTLQDKGTALTHLFSCFFGQAKLAQLQSALASYRREKKFEMVIGSGATTDAAVCIPSPTFDPGLQGMSYPFFNLKAFADNLQTWYQEGCQGHGLALCTAMRAIAVRNPNSIHPENQPHVFIPGLHTTFEPVPCDSKLVLLTQPQNDQIINAQDAHAVLMYQTHLAAALHIDRTKIIPVGMGNTVHTIDTLDIGHQSLEELAYLLADIDYTFHKQINVNTLCCTKILMNESANKNHTIYNLHDVVIEHPERGQQLIISFKRNDTAWHTWCLCINQNSTDHSHMPRRGAIYPRLDSSSQTTACHGVAARAIVYTPGSNGIGLTMTTL